jgi:membrane protease YdiL (CAAX protease family)
MTPTGPPNRIVLRRYVEALLFLAVWMGLGFAFHLDANAYLLLGVPLTVLFQCLVRRRPITALWVRDSPRFQLGWSGYFVAGVLAVLPLYFLFRVLQAQEWVVAGWFLCALTGAVAAAYSLRHFSSTTFRSLASCLLTAGVIGTGLFVLAWVEKGRPTPRPFFGLQYLFLYFAVVFVLEEVSFRGLLDAHLYHQGDRSRWTSAIVVSCLWGIWHLPIVPWQNAGVAITALSLLASHCPIGIFLSLYWRRSGNLAVPAFTHAFIDAVRNALIGGP